MAYRKLAEMDGKPKSSMMHAGPTGSGSHTTGGRHRRGCTARRILLLLILLGGSVRAEDDTPASAEIQYGAPQQIATLANQKINESSGLAASRIEPGLFWTHNDSGDSARVFAFDAAGRDRGEFELPGTKAIDWEDMASVTIDGKPYLILADVGDNARRRESCVLHVIAEPANPGRSNNSQPPNRPPRVIHFQYQDGPRDCEAMAVDPAGEQVFLVTKALALRCPVYQLDWPARESADVLVARRIGSVKLPLVTAMDISADGRRAIMLTYGDAYEFQRRDRESWADALARPPRLIAMPRRNQGESICYGQDSRTLYLTSERTPTPLWRVAPQVAP